MTQKSIRSFFKPTASVKEDEVKRMLVTNVKLLNNCVFRCSLLQTRPLSVGDVLMEKSSKKQRKRVLSSSDESDNQENEKKKQCSLVEEVIKEVSKSPPTKVAATPVKKAEKKTEKKSNSKKKQPKSPKVEAKQPTPKKEQKSPNSELPTKRNEENTAQNASPEVQTDKKEIKLVFGQKPAESAGTHDDYNPAIGKYHPIESATWKEGEKVPYVVLTRTLSEIEDISGRLKIVEVLSNLFRSIIVLTPSDLLPALYLCLNKLAPAYEGVELGVADTSLQKAIAQSTGRSMAQIRADCQSLGDIGLVAEQSKTNQRMIFQPARLTVRGVFDKLKEIAHLTGNSSHTKKVEKIQTMFVACKKSEARFLIRSLAGKLRIGLAEQSVLQALALACALTPPDQDRPFAVLNKSKKKSPEDFKAYYDELALTLKTTYCECPNYDLIIPRLLSDGIAKLPEHCKLTPGVPLKPMLAHPTKGIQEVLQRFDGLRFTCEFKYDGERAQIHIDDGKVSIFSRNQENNTSKYPDIIARVDKCKAETVKSCILDCEAVAWNRDNKIIMPFQVLSTRKRKDADEASIKVQVCVFMFDLLYLNGESLVRRPFVERRSLLREHFKEVEGEWLFVTCLDTSKMEEVAEFLEVSIKGNCEGLMVKTLEKDATYEIAKRSHNWLKLKKDYLDGVGDTLDLVVIGGYLGKGKRAGAYGGFLLACYDRDSEEYQSICKIGTGFSDEALAQHATLLGGHKLDAPKPYYRYAAGHEPDHWFDAVQVWEVKCADLSLSPAHQAAIGIVDAEKGISLRFPRFVRVREDKAVEEATSAQQVAEMYSGQDQVKNQVGGSRAEEDFY